MKRQVVRYRLAEQVVAGSGSCPWKMMSRATPQCSQLGSRAAGGLRWQRPKFGENMKGMSEESSALSSRKAVAVPCVC